jgi:hypothetical protein
MIFTVTTVILFYTVFFVSASKLNKTVATQH